MSESTGAHGIDELWEYGDPEGSERRFRQLALAAEGDERLELETQVARALGLRQRFAESHALLDEVQGRLSGAGIAPRVRYQLERGRLFNSSGEPERARRLFLDAWAAAQGAQLRGLAVDAAHMLAIISKGTPDAIAWNQRGLELARQSEDPKARGLIPAMLNNSAWELHEKGDYAGALKMFKAAQTAWEERGALKQIQIAHWSVARCLRSLGRYAEALSMQQELEAEHERAGTADGYVAEEIAENLAALGRIKEARPYFSSAYDRLSTDTWLAEHESERLASLLARSNS